MVAQLNHCAITGDVRHRGQGIHLLRARNARHHIDRDDIGGMLAADAEQILVLRRIKGRDQRLPGLQPPGLCCFGRAHLGDHIRLVPKRCGGFHYRCANAPIGFVNQPGGQARASLNETFVTHPLQLDCAVRRHRDARLARKHFFISPIRKFKKDCKAFVA